MTETCQQIIKSALRICRVVRNTEEPNAQQAADGIVTLNNMMHALKQQNADTGWTDRAIADDWPLQPETVEPCKYMLAARFASEYGKPFPPEAATIASEALPILQAMFGRRPRLQGDPAVTRRNRKWSTYDIQSGGYI